MIRACVFDLDGTLLNTVNALKVSMNLALEGVLEGSLKDEEVKRFVGTGTANYVKKTLKFLGDGELRHYETLLRRYKEFFSAHCLDGVGPYDGMVPALEALRKKGLPLAVFSNKPQEQVEDNIFGTFGRSLFDIVRGETAGVPLKPDPEGLYRILSALGAEPSETLYFGDTWTDMETGGNAGCVTVGVLWGFRGREELERYHPAAILEDPSGIPGLLERF